MTTIALYAGALMADQRHAQYSNEHCYLMTKIGRSSCNSLALAIGGYSREPRELNGLADTMVKVISGNKLCKQFPARKKEIETRLNLDAHVQKMITSKGDDSIIFIYNYGGVVHMRHMDENGKVHSVMPGTHFAYGTGKQAVGVMIHYLKQQDIIDHGRVMAHAAHCDNMTSLEHDIVYGALLNPMRGSEGNTHV